MFIKFKDVLVNTAMILVVDKHDFIFMPDQEKENYYSIEDRLSSGQMSWEFYSREKRDAAWLELEKKLLGEK